MKPTLDNRIRSRLDAVIHAERLERVPELVKAILVDSMHCGSLVVPESFRAPIAGTYARRLLYRDPGERYTMVVMTWGTGQKTALHDHAGIWCVECVVDGQMEVAQYELQSERNGRYQFAERSRVLAGRGTAGCLIPPFEYHTLGNAVATPSITLHVYGGEMDHCHVFEPEADGSYRRVRKELAYHN
jgi:3-mercaptopropionate dioxygenase